MVQANACKQQENDTIPGASRSATFPGKTMTISWDFTGSEFKEGEIIKIIRNVDSIPTSLNYQLPCKYTLCLTILANNRIKIVKWLIDFIFALFLNPLQWFIFYVHNMLVPQCWLDYTIKTCLADSLMANHGASAGPLKRMVYVLLPSRGEQTGNTLLGRVGRAGLDQWTPNF